MYFSNQQNKRFFLIAGPCAIESEYLALSTAEILKEICLELDIHFIYKSSFDKANRTSADSPRGVGRDQGLAILQKVKQEIGVPVLTDVHTISDVKVAQQAVDVLQTPAFLCRQTDLIEAVALSGKPANIKKGQFLAPLDMRNVVNKAKSANPDAEIMVCERGTSFGYNNLVVDMRGLDIMKETQCPIVFDATHSVQLPGGSGDRSGGQREFVPVLAKAALAVGVDGLFMETHPDPENAMSDGPNAWPLGKVKELLTTLIKVDNVAKELV